MFRFLFLIPALAMAFAQPPADLIGSIDFYGCGNLDVAKLREGLPFHVGDPVPARQALRELAGRKAVIERVCCRENGRTSVYIGLAEPDAPPIQYNPRPQADLRLPAAALQILEELEKHFSNAVERGVAGEDDSKGYALDEDPASRADQMKLLAWTRAHTPLVLQVLAESRYPRQRAFAAEALGYAERSPQQIAALVSASFDADGGVRNPAVRALEVLCTLGAEVTRQIPAARFLPFLHSLTWTDRNKGSILLADMAETGDPALLKLLHDQALGPLKEMALWSNKGHAWAALTILGRIAGEK
jgi:hypothetical protein